MQVYKLVSIRFKQWPAACICYYIIHNYWLEVDTLLLQRLTFCCTPGSSDLRSSLPELLRHTITIAPYSMYKVWVLNSPLHMG